MTFDPSKYLTSLNPIGRHKSASAFQGSELGAVTSILSDVWGLMGISGTPITNASASIPVTPRAPTKTPLLSPVCNTPTLLSHFLQDCEDDLGIPDATLYESPLRRKSYGPDILHRVSDSASESIGIPTGDVIRLKDASSPWYNSPAAKRRKVEVEKPAPAATIVSYERRWHDMDGMLTGASRFWGPPMTAGDARLEPGPEIWYKCTAREDWFPIPQGYEVQEEGVEQDPFTS